MNIPVKYFHHTGARMPFNWWFVTTVLFFILSVFMTFVALHNAKPMNCDDIVYDHINNVRICEVTIK